MPKHRQKINNVLPRGYLSPSSVKLLLEDEQKWVERYIYGRDDESTVYMDFGRSVADLVDDDIEISCILKRGKTKFKIMGKLDEYDEKTNTQIENKTSTSPWNQKKCDDLLQLKIYALIHYKNTGKIPRQELTWYETVKIKNKLTLTGKQRTFLIKRNLVDILETEAKMWKCFQRACELVDIENKKI